MKTPVFSPSTQLLELAALARIRLAVFPASLTFTADIFNIWKLSNNWTEITLEQAPEFHLRDCISDIASCVWCGTSHAWFLLWNYGSDMDRMCLPLLCLLMPTRLSASHLPRPFKLPSFFFLIIYVLMLFAARVRRVPAVSVPLQQHVCAVHGRACRCCVCFWPLASPSDWAAYQTGCALGAEFVSRHRPCQLAETGGRVDGLRGGGGVSE